MWLSGKHILATKGAVTAALADAFTADVDVVVDLTDARLMDASILGVMVHSRGSRGPWPEPDLSGSAACGAVRVIEVCGLAGLIEGPVGVAPAEWVAPSALETWVEVPPAGSPCQGRRPPGWVAAGNDAPRHAQ